MATTLCRIVLTVVTCTVNPATPVPSPAEAAAILVASLGPSRVPPPPFPRGFVDVLPYDRNWPFTGTFAPTWLPTDRRLDGTSLFDPPALYGLPFGVFGYGAGVGYGGGSAFIGGPAHPGVGRPGPVRPIERAPVTAPRVPGPAPSPAVGAPLAAPGGSVRRTVGKD
jgi:hypothetical protein